VRAQHVPTAQGFILKRGLRLLLASGNPHKVDELRAALPDFEIHAFAASDTPPENGATYVDNARIKARHARAHAPADTWVAGEDSGIEAAALGGRPGIESARWAKDGVSALLAALATEADRRIRFVSELVVISPNGDELRGTGTLDGVVADAPRGNQGFGYDPIVIPLGETLTVAELGDAWKSEHSHRASAARALREELLRRDR
jgi:XTP/dITP diphosphohydrolase